MKIVYKLLVFAILISCKSQNQSSSESKDSTNLNFPEDIDFPSGYDYSWNRNYNGDYLLDINDLNIRLLIQDSYRVGLDKNGLTETNEDVNLVVHDTINKFERFIFSSRKHNDLGMLLFSTDSLSNNLYSTRFINFLSLKIEKSDSSNVISFYKDVVPYLNNDSLSPLDELSKDVLSPIFENLEKMD